MIDFDDGDLLLNLIGIFLVLVLIVSASLLIFTTMNAPPTGQDDIPKGNWTLERVNSTHVRVTYANGEPIEAENLQITVNGRPRTTSWPGQFSRGDEGILRAKNDETVRVYWSGGRGDWVLLKEW